MSKKIVGLIVGLVVTALLTGALLFLLQTKPNNNTVSSEIESTSVALIKKDSDLIKDINVTNKKGSFKIEKVKKDYVIKELSKFDKNADNYNQIIQFASNLSASKEVEKSPENIKKYGLENPQSTVKMNYTDGDSITLFVGNITPDSTSYYVKTNKSDAVYMLSDAKTERFLDNKLDYISNVLTSTDNFETETVQNSNGEEAQQAVIPDIKSFEIIRNDIDKPITFVMTKDFSSNDQLAILECKYRLKSPVNANLDSEKGKEPVSLFYSITADSVVDIGLNEDKYAEYGFKNPTMILNMDSSVKKNSHTVTVGNGIKSDEKGNKDEIVAYYVILDNNDVIYKVSKDSLSWLTLNVQDILSEYIINPIIDEVSSIKLTANNKTYKFDITGNSAKVDENSSTTEDTTVVKCNGKKLNTDKFRTFYMFLNGITSVSLVDEKPTAAPVMTIEYTYRSSKRQKDIVKLIPYGNSKVAVSLNGDAYLVARSAFVDRAIENINKLLSNKEINAYW